MGEFDTYEIEDPDKPGEFYEVDLPKGSAPPGADDVTHILEGVRRQKAGQLPAGVPLAARPTPKSLEAPQWQRFTDPDTGDEYELAEGSMPPNQERLQKLLPFARQYRMDPDALDRERAMLFDAAPGSTSKLDEIKFRLSKRGSGRPTAPPRPPSKGVLSSISETLTALPGALVEGAANTADAGLGLLKGLGQAAIEDPLQFLGGPQEYIDDDQHAAPPTPGRILAGKAARSLVEQGKSLVPLRPLAAAAVSSKPEPPASEVLGEMWRTNPGGLALELVPGALPLAKGAARGAGRLAGRGGATLERLLDAEAPGSRATFEVAPKRLLGAPPARRLSKAQAGPLPERVADQMARNALAASDAVRSGTWADDLAAEGSAAVSSATPAAGTAQKVRTLKLGAVIRARKPLDAAELEKVLAVHQPAIEKLYAALEPPRRSRGGTYRAGETPVGSGGAGLRQKAKRELSALLTSGKPLSDSTREVILSAGGDGLKGATVRDLLRGAGLGLSDAISAPKSLQYGADLSVLRQAAPLIAARPRAGIKAARAMFQALATEEGAAASALELAGRPNAKLWREVGLAVSPARSGYTPGEELFRSRLAEKLPGAGKVIKASERAFSTALDRVRADAFDDALADFQKRGITPQTHPREVQALADYVNAMSGYSSLGKLESAAPVLQSLMSSPRLLKSRADVLNIIVGKNTPAAVRKLALRDSAAWLTTGASLLGLAKLAGLEVGTDPDSDWGKIIIPTPDGKQATRYEIFGGATPLARVLVLAAQSDEPQDWEKIGELLRTRGRATLSPTAGYALDQYLGEKITGEKADAKRDALNLAVPLWVQDLREAMAAHGSDRGALVGAPGAIGAGVATYERKR